MSDIPASATAAVVKELAANPTGRDALVVFGVVFGVIAVVVAIGEVIADADEWMEEDK